MRRDVFQAIADPNRRKIIQLVGRRSMSLNEVAARFDISRPAISKHIKILTECGLIRIRQEGRERICEARLRPLQEVAKWTEQYQLFWTAKLDALDEFLQLSASPKNKKSLTKKPNK